MKKLISVAMAITLLLGSFSVAAYAEPNTAKQLDLASVTGLLDYFVGSYTHTPDIAQTNAAVKEMIKNDAGSFFGLKESSVLDKNFMVPHSQQYYQPGVPGGICNKAAAMMLLSFYRDGKGYANLPSDTIMYTEISAMYESITKAFPAFFTNKFLNEEFDTSKSYEMFGTFEMGLAYYLYSKGYKDAAQNVINNVSCSIMMVPDKFSNSILKLLMAYFSTWLVTATNGELALNTNVKAKTNDAILNSIKSGEPVIIGCLTAIGTDIYAAHYFVGVGYYKMNCELKFGNRTMCAFNKEYVEVYDTWGQNSSVVNWTLFKNTAIYSSVTMADVG
jgi:hypothetical protein